MNCFYYKLSKQTQEKHLRVAEEGNWNSSASTSGVPAKGRAPTDQPSLGGPRVEERKQKLSQERPWTLGLKAADSEQEAEE